MTTDPVQKRIADELIDDIVKQISTDYGNKQSMFVTGNQAGTDFDKRGLVNIPYINVILGHDPYATVDSVSFKRQLVLIESIYRHLHFETADISTTPGFPTTGIFHLSQLGGHVIDEQYFQNLFYAIEDENPELADAMGKKSCGELKALALESIGKVSLPDPKKPGILYNVLSQ